MPDIICPLLGEGRKCVLNSCAWFYHFENKPKQAGECGILHLAKILDAVNFNLVGIKAKSK
jgi:hypothetical protein